MASFHITKMTSYRTNFQGYVPLHTVVGVATAFSSRLRGWKNLSDWLEIMSNIYAFTSEKKYPRRGSNRGPLGLKILRSECSSTVLAGPGLKRVCKKYFFMSLKYFVFCKLSKKNENKFKFEKEYLRIFFVSLHSKEKLTVQ